ncbi:MAG: hypothetical protein J6K53_05205 [Roseburia sp.]|nr:hypothetical protein [Roseburia sp.]
MSTKLRVMAVILCIYYLTDKIGCAGTTKSRIDERTVREIQHVQEWADAIDLWQGKNLRLIEFQRTGLGMWICYLEKKDAAVKNLAEIVEASNQFVEENPDYFQREDYNIGIYVGYDVSYDEAYYALSNCRPNWRFKMSGIDFEIEEDFRLQYFYVRGEQKMQQCLEMGKTKMDIPVVLWDMEGREISDQEEYDLSFLDSFSNLQYFVVNFDDIEQPADYTVLKGRIEEKLPDCEVYIVHNEKAQEE